MTVSTMNVSFLDARFPQVTSIGCYSVCLIRTTLTGGPLSNAFCSPRRSKANMRDLNMLRR